MVRNRWLVPYQVDGMLRSGNEDEIGAFADYLIGEVGTPVAYRVSGTPGMR